MAGVLAQFLSENGIDSRDIDILRDNRVDGSIFSELSESDFKEMFPAVGTKRQMMLQQKAWMQQQHDDSDLTLPASSSGSQSFSSLLDEVPLLQRENAMLPGQFSDLFGGDRPAVSEDTVVVLESNATNRVETSACGLQLSQQQSTPRKRGLYTLPEFSQLVLKALKDNQPWPRMKEVLAECWYHVNANGDMKNCSNYAQFCRLLCNEYPCLQFPNEGRHPWTHISKEISKKNRSERKKVKKMAKAGLSSSASLCTISDPSTLSLEEAYNRLMTEYANPECNWNTVVALFKFGHVDRRSKIENLRSISINAMLEDYPTLNNIKLVRLEFMMLISRNFEEMMKNYNNMLVTLDVMFAKSYKERPSEDEQVSTLLALQAKLVNNRIKKKSAYPAITVEHQAHNVLEDQRGEKLESPRLLILRHDTGNYQGWVIFGERNLECNERGGIISMVTDLVACYYAWHLQYPADYAILHFWQKVVVGDQKSTYRSPKYMEFLTNFREQSSGTGKE